MVSTLDLSSITDRLVEVLQAAIDNSPLWQDNGGPVAKFTIQVSGSMPETVRNGEGCQLTVYLLHLGAEPFTRNMALDSGAAQPNPRQALGLTLYYLVSAFAKGQPQQEQRAMSIAVKALHERATYVDPGDGFTFTVTLENEKPDEANRRWQSFSAPFRLSALYRVGVVFVTPQAPPPPLPARPHRLGLAVGPGPLPFARGGSLVASASNAEYKPFPPQPGDVITYDFSPAVASPGTSLAILGHNLSQPTTKQLYLLEPDGTERNVSPWQQAAGRTVSRVIVKLPQSVGVPPGESPSPGVYLLRVGSAVADGDAADYRSNAVTMVVTARVDKVPSPWTAVAGTFSFTGAGFVAGATEVLLDAVPLTGLAPGAMPGPGQFATDATGECIRFRPPGGLPAGTCTVRVRVKGTEGPPVGRITLP